MTARTTVGNQNPETPFGAASATQRLAPGSLDEDIDEQVLRDILGADIDHELLEFAAGAGGNPRLLAELALGLAEEGLVSERNGTIQLTRRRLPGRVLTFVKHRLGDLSTNCQQFLKVAAVLGRSFMLEDVSRMLDRSSASLLSPLDDAMASGFVVAGEHQFEFQSDFLLQGVIESIPGPARTALQREAIGRSGVPVQASDQQLWGAERRMQVADGRAASSNMVEGGAGEPYSTAHGLIADARVTEGIRFAERILSSPSSSASARIDAEACVILGYSILGKEQAAKHAEEILRERRAGFDDIAALMALTTLSNVRWRVGELTEGLSLGRTAVRYSENVDPIWRLHFQMALAGKLGNLREFDKAESLINEAEAGLRGLPKQVWAAAPAAMRSRLFLQAGRFGDARRQAELATAAVGQAAVPVLRPIAFSVLSTVSLYMGDLPAAVEYLKRMQSESSGDGEVLYSAQYAWTEVRVVAKREGPQAAIELLSGKYSHLPTRRSLYVEDPGAAAFFVRLALDMGDSSLKRSVLETMNGLAADNPGVSVIGLSAAHANALAKSDPGALSQIITRSPDPFDVALATGGRAKIYAAKSPARRQQTTSICSDLPLASPQEVEPQQDAACWASLSDMERRIAYLVSVGLTNRQIAKRVYLSAHTVNYHLRKVYRKLDISTRVELTRGATLQSMRD